MFELPFAKYQEYNFRSLDTLETVLHCPSISRRPKERIDIYQLINFTIKRGSFVRLSSPLAISDNELENGPETAEKPASQSFTFAVPPRYHLDSINFPSTLYRATNYRLACKIIVLFPLFSLSFHQTLLFHYN